MAAIYRSMIRFADRLVPTKFQASWNHPAGPKTIFFWAPCMKWALVVAGIGDISRPAEKLSPSQSTALACTGLVWSRYSFVITPINYNLFLVNVFVASTALYQLYRVYKYRQEQKKLKQQ